MTQNLERLYESNTIESKRDTVIHGLITYLGEKVEDLIKEYIVVDDDDFHHVKEDLSTLAIKIFVVKKSIDSSTTVGIAIDGEEVLTGMCSDEGCSLLMGIVYALNLSYPKELRYTFEVFQEVFLELDVGRTSSKVQALKTKMLA